MSNEVPESQLQPSAFLRFASYAMPGWTYGGSEAVRHRATAAESNCAEKQRTRAPCSARVSRVQFPTALGSKDPRTRKTPGNIALSATYRSAVFSVSNWLVVVLSYSKKMIRLASRITSSRSPHITWQAINPYPGTHRGDSLAHKPPLDLCQLKGSSRELPRQTTLRKKSGKNSTSVKNPKRPAGRRAPVGQILSSAINQPVFVVGWG